MGEFDPGKLLRLAEPFRVGWFVEFPVNGDPFIEFQWQENERPKRYKLRPLIEKLADMGVLEEIPVEGWDGRNCSPKVKLF